MLHTASNVSYFAAFAVFGSYVIWVEGGWLPSIADSAIELFGEYGGRLGSHVI